MNRQPTPHTKNTANELFNLTAKCIKQVKAVGHSVLKLKCRSQKLLVIAMGDIISPNLSLTRRPTSFHRCNTLCNI